MVPISLEQLVTTWGLSDSHLGMNNEAQKEIANLSIGTPHVNDNADK